MDFRYGTCMLLRHIYFTLVQQIRQLINHILVVCDPTDDTSKASQIKNFQILKQTLLNIILCDINSLAPGRYGIVFKINIISKLII